MGGSVLTWIIASGIIMTAIAGVGSITLLFREHTIRRLLMPLVAFSAGTLLGGAFFHMLPAAWPEFNSDIVFFSWVSAGFIVFFALEQFLHWHQCQHGDPEEEWHCGEEDQHNHPMTQQKDKPLVWLILIGDGLHNFIGGIAIAGTFLIDIHLGITTFLAAAAHEFPQELGDFGVLLHSGLSKYKALIYNMISALTFLIGGLLAYGASKSFPVHYLVPFAAGNFIYIGATDLVPRFIRHENLKNNLVHFVAFVSGMALLVVLKMILAD